MDSLDPSPPYRGYPLRNVAVTEVQPDNHRLFVVASGTRARTGQPWTLVLERQNDYWISRRDLNGLFDPEAAVSGYLFNREGYQDPLEMLRRMNEVVRTEYYRLLQEKTQGERIRGDLVEELARLKGECDALKAQLQRKIGTGDVPGRRASASSRKRSARRRRRSR
jgi:hypothetical protein